MVKPWSVIAEKLKSRTQGLEKAEETQSKGTEVPAHTSVRTVHSS